MKPRTPTPTGERERFLTRWSRLKRTSAAPAARPGPASAASPSPGVPPVAVPAGTSQPRAPNVDDVPQLPPIDSLSIDSDFAPFFQPKVPESLRRAAVKKLFADPHFNVMDGLDVYIDDYSKPDPIPPEMLNRILHARDLIDHPSNRVEPDAESSAAPAEDAAPQANAEPPVADSPETPTPDVATQAPDTSEAPHPNPAIPVVGKADAPASITAGADSRSPGTP
jgi:hypothetical protein